MEGDWHYIELVPTLNFSARQFLRPKLWVNIFGTVYVGYSVDFADQVIN